MTQLHWVKIDRHLHQLYDGPRFTGYYVIGFFLNHLVKDGTGSLGFYGSFKDTRGIAERAYNTEQGTNT